MFQEYFSVNQKALFLALKKVSGHAVGFAFYKPFCDNDACEFCLKSCIRQSMKPNLSLKRSSNF